MFRVVLVAAACLLLAGCWVSERQMFDSGDWVNLDLDGEYELETGIGFEGGGRVRLSTRDDGLIESVPQDENAGERETSVFGLVAIPGGSGRFFLAADRSNPDDDQANIYYIAHLTDGDELAIYYPDCRGTAARDGLVFDEESKGGLTCVFTSEQALFEAALEAERFLSMRHIVAVAPIYTLKPVEEEAVVE